MLGGLVVITSPRRLHQACRELHRSLLACNGRAMPNPNIPDIQPFIANDQSAIRYYFSFAIFVFFLGMAIIAVTFYPALRAENIIQDIAQRVGGVFVSGLSAFPIKELLARRDRLRVLGALEKRIRQLSRLKAPPEDDVRRVRELVWEIYKKGALGS
jgi:hypothetical protein